MNKLLAIIFVLVYNIFLIGGTVYLIDARGWSPWWFLLTFSLMLGLKGKVE